MNWTIWKFPIELIDEQDVKMPLGAEILTIQWQGSQLCLWAKVLPERDLVSRRIIVHGTGHPMPRHDARYIATVQAHGGALIFHAFDGGPVT